MFCVKCGKELKEGEIFCNKCGNKINDNNDNVDNNNKTKKIFVIGAIILAFLFFISLITDTIMMSFIYLIFFIVDIVYIFNNKKAKNDDILTTDMEIYIAQLEIKPESNKRIKNVAKYLETIIMPNEKILAVAYAYIYAIVTDKRVIIRAEKSGCVTIIPIEKITTVTQNGGRVYINNQTWVNLQSIELANKFMNIVNNQVSSFQTLNQAIKIENKIVTEETITSQLQKLSDLHDAKVLTDYEYSMKKQELLNK